MTSFPFNMFPFSQAIDRFNYDPATNWQGAFSTNFIFNANPQDAPMEAHVLARTGSYGKQLGVLIRMVDLLQSRIDRKTLGKEEAEALSAFVQLRDDAAKAARDFRHRVSAEDIVKLARAFGEDRSSFERRALRESLDKALRDED